MRACGVRGSRKDHCSQPRSLSSASRKTSSYASSQPAFREDQSPTSEMTWCAISLHRGHSLKRCRTTCCDSSLEASARRKRPKSSSGTCHSAMSFPPCLSCFRVGNPTPKAGIGQKNRRHVPAASEESSIRQLAVRVHATPAVRAAPRGGGGCGAPVRVHGAAALGDPGDETAERLPEPGHDAGRLLPRGRLAGRHRGHGRQGEDQEENSGAKPCTADHEG